MEIIQYSNGPEGAKNPSTQNNVGIQTPDSGSSRRTHYRAAIAEFIGCRRMARRITDIRDGIEYTFNFYHPLCGRLFKVFRSGDLTEFEKYTSYPGDAVIIVNVDDHPDCEVDEETCCDDMCITLPRAFTEKLETAKVAYVYFEGHLCEYVADVGENESVWDSLKPDRLCEFEEDEEDEN